MDKKQKILAAEMLDLAANEFGNHGCNDVDEELFKDWTKEERQAFVKGYHAWNGDPEEYDEDYLHLPDWCIMNFLADTLKCE